MYAQVYIDAISIHHIYDVIVYFVLFKKAPYLSDHMCCVLKTPRCLSGWLSSFRRGSGHCVSLKRSQLESKQTHSRGFADHAGSAGAGEESAARVRAGPGGGVGRKEWGWCGLGIE